MQTNGPVATTHRSRAVILSFGGWGLQAMLHLWPRLRLLQEEREALGIANRLPDLDQMAAFAAVVPEPLAASGGKSLLSCHVVHPHPTRYPWPSYLEELSHSPDADRAEPAAALAPSEREAIRLLYRAQADGFLLPVPLHEPLRGEGTLCRKEMFRLGVQWARNIAASLISEVVDPTRLDRIQTRDPLVQTTVYVIAALGEPLASALLWPVVSEVVAGLRHIRVARVVAFLGTGSFASGYERTVEEAAVHAALTDIEKLTGLAGDENAAHFVREFPVLQERPELQERVGETLFDTIYLVDREKNNLALAQDSLELAVLVGNVLEAFLVANGMNFIEQQLGPDLERGVRFPYGVLGAASNYIPLASAIGRVIEDHQKLIVQDEVLNAPDSGERLQTSLEELGISPPQVLRPFVEAATGLFSAQASNGWLPSMEVADGQIMSPSFLAQLRQVKHRAEWQSLVEERRQAAVDEVEGIYGTAATVWGVQESQPPTRESGEQGKTVSQAEPGVEPDRVPMVPAAIDAAVAAVVTDICSSPSGILRARERVAAWVDEVEAILADLDRDNAQHTHENGHTPNNHIAEYIALARSVENAPLRLGGLLGGVLLWLIALGLVFFGEISPFWKFLAVGYVLLAPVALALVIRELATQRLSKPMRRSLLGAQAHLSLAANRLLHRGLSRVYRSMHAELDLLRVALEAAIGELREWAQPADAQATPEQVEMQLDTHVHLRRPHVPEGMWRRVHEHVKARAEDAGHGAVFSQLWRTAQAARDWQGEDTDLERRVRASLEVQCAQAVSRGHKTRRRLLPGAGEPSLAELIRNIAAGATEYLCPQHRLFADYAGLVRETAEKCRIENVLFGGRDLLATPRQSSMEPVVFMEDISARAKPSANYEITYTFSVDVGEVEFVVTPNGRDSILERAATQRTMPLLASHDPLSVSVIRSVNRLALPELTLSERCSRQYERLKAEDVERLALLPSQ